VGIEVHDVVGSTNAEAAARAVPWLAVVAEAQSAGRGRLDRSWTTTPGRSLAVSALVPAPGLPGWVPLVTGLALLRAVEEACAIAVALKWPNDVLCPADGDRKLAGILCEWLPGPGSGIVVGTGLNVGQGRAELPVDTATSLRLCGASDISRERLLTAYLTHLAGLVGELDEAGDADGVRAAYRRRCVTIGRDVLVHLPDGTTRSGRATQVDDDGRLVLDTPNGAYAASAGDVVHVRTA
jgi:BirA family biotin operon repressor/biotin-[acetyl-CoA-carboxylase] ligase